MQTASFPMQSTISNNRHHCSAFNFAVVEKKSQLQLYCGVDSDFKMHSFKYMYIFSILAECDVNASDEGIIPCPFADRCGSAETIGAGVALPNLCHLSTRSDQHSSPRSALTTAMSRKCGKNVE